MFDISELDTLIKELEDVDVVSLYQDNDHIVELSHKSGAFFVRLDGANLYSGSDGEEAASVFYTQVAQIKDDAERGSDPAFATLREILQSRNAHVKDMLAAIGHEHLAASLNGIEFAKEFTLEGFREVIKHNRNTLDVLDFANYRPPETEGEECHTCIFFAAGGYCTKLDVPVKEEMYCDLFKPLPMAEKNERWAEVSNQPWEEGEHRESEPIEGLDKDVRNLIYTSKNKLETPSEFEEGSRKPNIIMREYIPEDAEEGFAILVKNADSDGVIIELTYENGQWYAISKQRDVSDLGDPFQSVGDAYIPRKVKNRDEEDKEGIEKLKEVLGQEEFQKATDGLSDEELEAVDKALPAIIPAIGAAAVRVLPIAAKVATRLAPTIVGAVGRGAVSGAISGAGKVADAVGEAIPEVDTESGSEREAPLTEHESEFQSAGKNERKPNLVGKTKVPRLVKAMQDQFKNLEYSEINEGRVDKEIPNLDKSDVSKAGWGQIGTGPDGRIYWPGGSRVGPKGGKYSMPGDKEYLEAHQGGRFKQKPTEEAAPPEQQQWDRKAVQQTMPQTQLERDMENFKGFDKGQSNEGGLGVDDPEALNDGTGASSQHYRRIREDEENSKSSLAMKAYANDSKDVQKPIDPDEDGREALSSAETGTGTQAFSSGAVIDISPEETDGVNVNTKASGGTGGEGVEGGGDGSATMIAPADATDQDLESDYDSMLNPIKRGPIIKEGGGAGGGAGGDGGGGGVGTSGSFGGGTALSVGGSGGDAVHTDTHGRVARKRNSNGQEGLDKGSLSKDSMDAGAYEGVSQLPYPQDDDSRPPRTVERYKHGDSEDDDAEQRASEQEHQIPNEQQPIGEDYASSYVIAEDEDRYSPTEIVEKPENELVRRRFIDEDNRLKSINDNAAEQYTNLAMLSRDLQSRFVKADDTPESLKEIDAFRVLNENSIQKMDTGRTLVVAGWGNYYIVDREGHRLGLEGMRKAMVNFLGKKEFANMNIFHSGIQVGQILRKFIDINGKEWRTEVKPEGLFVVAAFRTDLEVSRKAMAEVIRGGMRGFSIAGNAKSKDQICEHGKCWTEVTDLEIYEVTLCVTPMNPKSYITDILQKPDPEICPECYETNNTQYDSSLRPR